MNIDIRTDSEIEVTSITFADPNRCDCTASEFDITEYGQICLRDTDSNEPCGAILISDVPNLILALQKLLELKA